MKSHHHQGVDELGEGLVGERLGRRRRHRRGDRAAGQGLTPLGVLWHPEEDERSRVVGALVGGGRARRSRGGASGERRDPGPRAGHRGGHGRAARRRASRRPTPRSRARKAASRPGAPWRPATAPRCCHRLARRARGERRGARPARGAQRRQADLGRARRDGHGGRRPSATTRERPSACRPHHPGGGGVDMTFREPLGVVGLITPWNFPLHDRVLEAGAGAGGRQHGRAQAGRAHAAHRDRVRADRARGRHPGGRGERGGGAGLASAAQRLVEHEDVAKIAFTGSTEVGRADRGRRGRDDQARDARAGRKVRERDLRRRRPREGRRLRAERGVRQRRPGLLRALAHPRRALRPRPLHGGARGVGRGDQGGRPARRVHRDGPADLGGSARDRRRRS